MGFPPSFAPRRPGAGRRTSGRGQAIEHGPGTHALRHISRSSNPACSLNACDLASHGDEQVRRDAWVETRIRARGGMVGGYGLRDRVCRARAAAFGRVGRVGMVPALHQHRQSGRRRRHCATTAHPGDGRVSAPRTGGLLRILGSESHGHLFCVRRAKQESAERAWGHPVVVQQCARRPCGLPLLIDWADARRRLVQAPAGSGPQP